MANRRVEEGALLNGIYELTEKLSAGLTGEVWKAEDTLRGRTVSTKILGGEVKVDRQQIADFARSRIGLRHNGIAQNLDVITEGAVWFVVRDFAEGVSLALMLDGRPLDRTRMFHFALQIVRALAFAHTRNVVHGNLNGASVIINPRTGRSKIVGWGLIKTAPQKQQAAGPQRLSHLSIHEVYSMAPEQISGQLPDLRSDMFSLGVVLYEMLTGRIPFPGSTSLEVLGAIMQSQPASPSALNPSVSAGFVSMVGKCLQKEPSKRYPNAEELWFDLRKEAGLLQVQDAEIQALLAEEPETSRLSAILVAEIHKLDDIEKHDSPRAQRMLLLMQELMWPCVHEMNGLVIDPLASRLTAEFSDTNRALSAARKAVSEVVRHNRDAPADSLPVSMVIHRGMLTEREGLITGPSLPLAYGALPSVPPAQVYISEEVAEEVKLDRQARPALIFSGAKFYHYIFKESVPTKAAAKTPASARPVSKPVAYRPRSSNGLNRTALLILAGVIASAVIAGSIAYVSLREPQAAAPVVAAPTPAPKLPRIQRVFLQPLSIEGANPGDAKIAPAWAGFAEILRSVDNVEILQQPRADAVTLTGSLRPGADGAPQIVPAMVRGGALIEGPPIAASSAGGAMHGLLQWASNEMRLSQTPFTSINAETLDDFAPAAAAFARGAEGYKDANKSIEAALRSDPEFLPALLLSADILAGTGDSVGAMKAAEKAAWIGGPNLNVARRLASWHHHNGSSSGAARAYVIILSRLPDDDAALAGMIRLALAAGDEGSFSRLLPRVKKSASDVHDADIQVAQGKIDSAANRYYDLQSSGDAGGALNYKIGRIAVLRHSLDVARTELDRLRKSDQGFRPAMLSALIAAEERRNVEAEALLIEALGMSSSWSDEPHTRAAEAYAILGRTDKVLASLEKATQKSEPTFSYILNSPLFKYYGKERRFDKIRATCEQQQRDIRAELARIR